MLPVLRQTTAAGSGVQAWAATITPISSPVSVPCRNSASAISRMHSCAHCVRTRRSAASRKRAISARSAAAEPPRQLIPRHFIIGLIAAVGDRATEGLFADWPGQTFPPARRSAGFRHHPNVTEQPVVIRPNWSRLQRTEHF
jgi:hypothetical protein